MRLTCDDLSGQFVVCRAPQLIPSTWPRRQREGWLLGSHPDLPVLDLAAADGSRIGWVLGYPVAPAGRFVKHEIQVDAQPDAPDLVDRFECRLYEHGGRYAACLLTSKAQRFYLDACGSLAAVYCPRHETVAATPTLVPRADGCEEDPQRVRAVMVPGHDNWYPFGLTPRRSVERLLPNHYLDLSTWRSVRHWPTGEIEPVGDAEAAARDIAGVLKRQIAAVANEHPFWMSLTAGRDARVLLACSRDHVARASLFTVAIPSPGGRRDARVAPKIARRFRLSHRSVPYVEPSESDLGEMRFRNGGCADGFHARMARTHERLPSAQPVLLGAGGELGRCFHWRRGDTESTPVRPGDLLDHQVRLLHEMDLPELERRAEDWLGALPVRNTLTVWGLLFNEGLNGCWFGPLLYGMTGKPFYLFPFCHRGVLGKMMSLPTPYRREMRLEVEIIRSEWPELLSVPFNWPTGFRKHVFFVRRHARRLRRRLAALAGADRGAVCGGQHR